MREEGWKGEGGGRREDEDVVMVHAYENGGKDTMDEHTNMITQAYKLHE